MSSNKSVAVDFAEYIRMGQGKWNFVWKAGLAVSAVAGVVVEREKTANSKGFTGISIGITV